MSLTAWPCWLDCRTCGFKYYLHKTRISSVTCIRAADVIFAPCEADTWWGRLKLRSFGAKATVRVLRAKRSGTRRREKRNDVLHSHNSTETYSHEGYQDCGYARFSAALSGRQIIEGLGSHPIQEHMQEVLETFRPAGPVRVLEILILCVAW